MEPEVRKSLNLCIGWGLGAVALGVVIAGINMPHTEVTFSGVEESGSAGAALVGFLILWLGSMLAFVGLVGYGVALGRPATPMRWRHEQKGG